MKQIPRTVNGRPTRRGKAPRGMVIYAKDEIIYGSYAHPSQGMPKDFIGTLPGTDKYVTPNTIEALREIPKRALIVSGYPGSLKDIKESLIKQVGVHMQAARYVLSGLNVDHKAPCPAGIEDKTIHDITDGAELKWWTDKMSEAIGELYE